MVVLLPQNQISTDQLIAALLLEGVKVAHYQWEHTLRDLTLPQSIDKAVLIPSTPSIVSIGERTKETRLQVSNETHLIVCAPTLTEKERQALSECGADTIIAPRSYSPEHLAERITAELILQGNGHLSSFGSLRGATRHSRKARRPSPTRAG